MRAPILLTDAFFLDWVLMVFPPIMRASSSILQFSQELTLIKRPFVESKVKYRSTLMLEKVIGRSSNTDLPTPPLNIRIEYIKENEKRGQLI